MRISVRGATTVLVACAVTLSLIGLAYALQFSPGDEDGLGPHAPAALIRLFDLDAEANIPTWFESALMLVAAALSAVLASAGVARTSWCLVAAALAVMSCDEVAGIHEMVGHFVSARLGWSEPLVYGWLVPGAVAAVALALLARRAATALDATTRRRMILAGALFFGGALGVEVVEARVDLRLYGTAAFGAIAWAEESLELAGLLVFTHALMARLRDHPPSGITFAR